MPHRSQPVKVLVVEDNPGDLRLIEEYLRGRSAEFEIRQAGSLAEALAAVDEERFDVILSDLGLPDSRGLATMEALHASTPATPLVILSSANDRETALRAVRAGAQDYLVKGALDPDLLSRSLQYAIERKASEERARVAESRFASVTESASDGIMMVDRHLDVVFANPAANRMFVGGADQLEGRNLRSFFSTPRDQQSLDQLVEFWTNYEGDLSGSEGARFSQVELQPISHTGVPLTLEMSAAPWRARGDLHITCIMRDVTRRRQTERDLEEHRVQLATAQEMAHIGSFSWDLADESMDWSDELYAILGCDPTLDAPSLALLMDALHDEDRPTVERGIKRVVRAGDPIDLGCRIILPMGGVRFLRLRMALADDVLSDGHVVPRVIGVIQDVTDQKEAEGALVENYERLVRSEKLAALGTLIAGVAHEINNPLAFVKNNEQVIRTLLARARDNDGSVSLDPAKVDRLLKFLATNRVGIERIESIVRSLRQVTRPATGDRRRFDLYDLMTETLPVLESVRREHDVHIDVQSVEVDLAILGNQTEISQIVLNLVKNAIEASPPDGVVRLTAGVDGDVRWLSISDEGPGIPAAEVERIFDPFYTTKADGTGLGLAISARVAESHGGSLRCKEAEGGGACFTLRLPPPESAPEQAQLQRMDVRHLGRSSAVLKASEAATSPARPE